MFIKGIVQKGKQRGKDLGFPTANIPLIEKLEDGIYISRVTIDSKLHQALTFIGAAETFDETERFAETYIFDFNQDIYGKHIIIELLKKLRGNQKFDTVEALVKQMEDDTMKARKFFERLESSG